ncbi:hypothetical protein ACWD7C_32665 [Streptomyces sp. NPDC005134]|uniref:hypothetical protein n=1 Tax=Streptomyces sp. NPDC005098 TaxID=3154560 RepID=UPI0033A6B237
MGKLIHRVQERNVQIDVVPVREDKHGPQTIGKFVLQSGTPARHVTGTFLGHDDLCQITDVPDEYLGLRQQFCHVRHLL